MPATRRVRMLTLVATALGSALAFLDTTVVVVALPSIEADLDLGLVGQQWVYLAYALSLSAFYLVSGAVGDRIGLRRAFVGATVLFAAASALCALAPTGGALLAGRAVQGVGGAALTTTSLALLRVTWSGEAGRAIGLWTSLTSLATVGGPPLGGVIVETLSWRWVFLINVPLAAVVVALALAGRGTADRPPRRRADIDLVGAVLAAVGLAGLTFGVVEVRDRGLVAVLPAFVGGAAALGALGMRTFRAKSPLVPPALLRRPGLVRANVVTLSIYAALGTQLLFLPLYVQFLGASAVVAGLVFLPPSVALVALAPRFGRIADRDGPRRPIAGGAAAISVAALLLVPVGEVSDLWTWGIASLFVFAVGLSAVVAPITAAALAPAPDELAGIASGLNQTVARVGGICAVAVVGALAGAVYAATGGSLETPFDVGALGADFDAGVSSFRSVALSVAVLAGVSSLLAVLLLRDGVATDVPRGRP